MKVAGIQLVVSRKSKEKNLQKAEEWTKKAAKKGAKIVLLQEFFATGSFTVEANRKNFSLAEKEDGETITRMSKLAKQLGIWMIVPLFEHDNEITGRYYNSAFVLNPDGKIIGKYRKQFIPYSASCEKFYFTPGNLGTPVFKIPGLTFGIIICYDRHFFELPRILVLKGAEVIFVTSSSHKAIGRSNVWQPELISMAENNCAYVVAVNSVGHEDREQFGLSIAVDPLGEVISSLGDEEEGMVLADILPEKVTESRVINFHLRDYRIDILEELLNLYKR